jgi:DNA-binding CsgD family transcriptional regulator
MAPRPRDRDGEWLDLVADLVAAPPRCWPDERVAKLLLATFDAPACSYYSRGPDSAESRGWPPEHFAGHLDEALHWSEHEAPTRHPLLRYYRVTGDVGCMQVADVPRAIADRRITAAWTELGKRWGGVQAQVSIPVLAGAHTNRAFIIGREDPFTGAEMAAARRLQPLFVGLDRQISTFRRWTARSGPIAVDVAAAVRLTPRELAVLELLAGGLTATAIAHRLGIAERTVQKHLQRCYAKLGVADRLAAVQRAQGIGVLRVP